MNSKKPTSDLNAIEERALLEEFERRQRQKESHSSKYAATSAELTVASRMRAEMFPQQRALFESPSTRKVGFCTRRAGKTIGTALNLLAALMEHPADLFLYMAQTRELAKVYMWKEMREWAAKFELPLDFNESYMWVKHQRGGGTIILRGADNEREVNKLRGPKWREVWLDESSTYGSWMEQLVVEVIGPALRDQNGVLGLIGTAGRKREGLFYEACHGLRKWKTGPKVGQPIYELHQWSLVDNPHLSDQAKDLTLIMDEDGMSENDPRFLREYKMIWASGDSERVWSGYDPDRNDVVLSEGLNSLPRDHHWETLLGMDFGWQDESGIAVLAWSKTTKRIYILETWAKNHAFSDEIAMKVEEFRGKYAVRRCIGDVGGQGKIFQQQLQRDYKIYVEPAKKMEKLSYIEFMNSALMRGDLLIAAGDKVGREMLDVAWDADRKQIGKHEKDNRAHACFVSGTPVWTARGPMPIENVDVGDCVMTREGWKSVEWAGMTGRRPTVTLTFSTGAVLECTSDHLFWTHNRGWVAAGALTYSDACAVGGAVGGDVTPALGVAHILDMTVNEEAEAVFDLTVRDCHEFFANGMLVHNSLYGWRAANYVAGKSQLAEKQGTMTKSEFARREKLAVFAQKPKKTANFWELDGTDSRRPNDADSSFAAEYRRLVQGGRSGNLIRSGGK